MRLYIVTSTLLKTPKKLFGLRSYDIKERNGDQENAKKKKEEIFPIESPSMKGLKLSTRERNMDIGKEILL